MPLERRHLRIPAAIALVAVTAFAVLWAGARTPLARGWVERAVTDATGLPSTVGRLRVGFLPSPRLTIDGLAIAQPPGYGEEPLLEVERVEASLPWRRLVGLTERIEAVAVLGAVARLRVGVDGVTNWSVLLPEPTADEAPQPPSQRQLRRHHRRRRRARQPRVLAGDDRSQLGNRARRDMGLDSRCDGR